MRTAIALLLAASLAHAEPPDAPLVDPGASTLQAGHALDYDAVCMPGPKAIEVGKRIASCEASLTATETKTVISTPVLVGGIVAIVVTAFAVGAATAYAVKR